MFYLVEILIPSTYLFFSLALKLHLFEMMCENLIKQIIYVMYIA